MDEAELRCFSAGYDAVTHEEVHRLGHAEQLHEQVLSTFVRHQAETKRAAANTGVL